MEDEFLRRYPGLCPQCGFVICVCPSVPDATVGRMAKELEIGSEEDLFILDPGCFAEEGKAVATEALDRAGGYSALVLGFPFDRGDANKALVLLCLRLADAVQEAKPDIGEILNAATADDFRRVLLNNAFEIVHLAGHGDSEVFLLHGSGNGSPMPMASLRELIQRHPTVRCAILNSCHSASSLTEAIAP